MREEIGHWWEQAKRDLVSAENCLRSGDYYLCAFVCHQTIEKALKAYIMKTSGESPGAIHSLVRLSRIAVLPASFQPFIRQLAPEYFVSRYPDAIDDVPYKQYTEDEVDHILMKTKEVMAWFDARMSKQ